MSSTYSYRPPLGLDIRVNPPNELAKDPAKRKCAWHGCSKVGNYRAPKRDNPSDFQWLCLDHVQKFNRSWNFFEGMADNDIQRFVENSITGNRPTWSMGTNGTRPDNQDAKASTGFSMKGGLKWSYDYLDGIGDTFNLLSDLAKHGHAPVKPSAPSLTRRQAKALETLDLVETVTHSEIKTKYKKLVKKYHPDANGGDTGTVERLRSIIQAYHILKTANFATND